jgi:hypothetical protein
MKQIRFDSTVFDLVSNPNISIDRLQATILKGENTVESIANAATNAETIAILEDGEVIGLYNDYNILIATVLRKDQEIDFEGTTADTVSVELRSNDIAVQIETLDSNLGRVESRQNSQGAQISNLGVEVSKKLDSSVVGDAETIGSPSSKKYEIGDTFMGSDGKYYKAISTIPVDSVLVIGGNCEVTDITSELQNVKEVE